MNSHPYGISNLTATRSQELLSEGRRRQLAKTALPGIGRLSENPPTWCTAAHLGSWPWLARFYGLSSAPLTGVRRPKVGPPTSRPLIRP